jgi:hypothetical protein
VQRDEEEKNMRGRKARRIEIEGLVNSQWKFQKENGDADREALFKEIKGRHFSELNEGSHLQIKSAHLQLSRINKRQLTQQDF